jgi:Yip1 domain
MSKQEANGNRNSYATDQASSIKPPQLSETIWHLPRQYVKVLFKPSVHTFREEMGKAGWGIVLVQFYLLFVITVVLSYLGHIIPSSALHTTSAFSIGTYRLFSFLPSPYNGITFILGSFLIGLGTAYLFSRLWRGQGRFLAHAYCLLLCTIPLVTISGALLLIPASGSLVILLTFLVSALFIYRMVLHGCIIMGVHGLSASKATLIVLIFPMFIVGLVMIAIMLFAILVIFYIGAEVAGDALPGLFELLEWFPGKGNKPKDT